MSKPILYFLTSLAFFCAFSASKGNTPAREPAASHGLGSLFAERVKSVVAIKLFIQRDEDRENRSFFGLVIDRQGVVTAVEGCLPEWLPPERFRDIRIFALGVESEGAAARYLGQDFLSGNHYFQIEGPEREAFTPIQEFGETRLDYGDLVWGIGANDENWNHMPYFLSGRLATYVYLPLEMGFSPDAVGVSGGPVFSESGTFAGWLQMPFNDTKFLIQNGRTSLVQLRDPRESTAFLSASEFYSSIRNRPLDPAGDPRPWIGVSGLQNLQKEAARFLKLEGRGAVVVSDIFVDSPADKAGLKSQDIIIEVDGSPLPVFIPEEVVVRWLTRQILMRPIGSTVQFKVNRAGEELTIDLVLEPAPKPANRASRQFFSRVGVAIREYLLEDALNLRNLKYEELGVVAEYVSPNKPASSGGLGTGDWIKEIDGQKIQTFGDAVRLLKEIEANAEKSEAILLVERGSETQVLRIKLK